MRNNNGAVVLLIFAFIACSILGMMYFIFNPYDAGTESVTVTDIETGELHITIVFSNGEEKSYTKSRVDTSLIRSFKNHNAILYYSKVPLVDKYLSDFRIFFEKNTTIKQVLYKEDGLFPWEHPPVKIIFGDGSNFMIYGSSDYKFDVYSQCVVQNDNQVLFKYYVNDNLDYKFSSIQSLEDRENL